LALVRAAKRALERGFDRERHTVAAAVRTRSGMVYLGLNLNGIHTPCAEPVAMGAAVTRGDREMEVMVAVKRKGKRYRVLSPCGTCRQLLFDYSPNASVIVRFRNGRVARLTVGESLPAAYATFDDKRTVPRTPRQGRGDAEPARGRRHSVHG
jgi:cytidine deaminase